MVTTLAPVETPNVNPLALLNVMPVTLLWLFPAPPETLRPDISPAVTGTVYEPVMACPALLPKLIPLALEKLIVPEV